LEDDQAASRNLQGLIRELPMREVRDGTAVYYLGEFRSSTRRR